MAEISDESLSEKEEASSQNLSEALSERVIEVGDGSSSGLIEPVGKIINDEPRTVRVEDITQSSEPGKNDERQTLHADEGEIVLPKQVSDWCKNLVRGMSRISECVEQLITGKDEKLHAELEDIALTLKWRWNQATEEQKRAWRVFKQETIGRAELDSRSIDVISSVASRWIHQTHCACPICWKSGITMSFDGNSQFANNNNTFTWSGPSGVLGCTGQRREAPPLGGVQPSTKTSYGCHAVPLNLLNRGW
jgi:hypothetical protein